MEGRQSKRRSLTRVSFRYLSVERIVVLLDIDVETDIQYEIVRTVNKIEELYSKHYFMITIPNNFFSRTLI